MASAKRSKRNMKNKSLERFGEQGKPILKRAKKNVKSWSKADWDDSARI